MNGREQWLRRLQGRYDPHQRYRPFPQRDRNTMPAERRVHFGAHRFPLFSSNHSRSSNARSEKGDPVGEAPMLGPTDQQPQRVVSARKGYI